jgi:hypothetical protein
VPNLIRIADEEILSIFPPEEQGGPFRITAFLKDREGKKILEVIENEWRPSVANWDVEVVGRRITIRRGPGDLSLVIRSEPPHRIVFERIEMEHRGVRISGQEGKAITIRAGRTHLITEGLTCEGCKTGIEFNDGNIGIGGGGGRTSIDSLSGWFAPKRPDVARPSRNAPCPCGSGKRFKRCHGAI